MNSPHDYHLLHSTLTIAVVLFVVAAVGFAARRNLVVMFFSAAIMLQGAVLACCALGSFHGDWTGRTAGLIVSAVTLSAGVLTAAFATKLVEREGTLDVSRLRQLGEDGGEGDSEAAHE